MFSFFKKRKERKQREAQMKIVRASIIRKEIQIVEQRAEEISYNANKNDREWADRVNSSCPKCKSKNVNDRIKRIQGSLEGEISGSGWSALSFGSSRMSGSIKGELDTNEVNKCNDCQNEWQKREYSYTWASKVIESNCDEVDYYMRKLHRLKNVTFNPLDTSEKYNSLEEKIEAEKKDFERYNRKEHIQKFWAGISLDTCLELINKNINKYSLENFYQAYDESAMLELGFRKITEEELQSA